MSSSRLYLAVLLLLAFFPACNSAERGPCLEPKVSKLQLVCKRYDTAAAVFADTLLVNANLYSPDIDSAQYWYWGVKKINQFQLILSPLKDSLRWVLQPDSAIGIKDTFSFIYTSRLHFLSNACGFTHQYTLLSVATTHHQVDSISIIEPSVTNKAGVTHVQVFF